MLRGVSSPVVDTMIQAKRPGSLKLYGTYVKLWMNYAEGHRINKYNPRVPQVLNFLDALHKEGRGYSALNTARSALSAFLPLYEGLSIGGHPYVRLFLKGVYNISHPTPRYMNTWDLQLVLNFLKSWSPMSKLSLEKLTLKLVVLLLMVTGQRPQFVRALDTRNMHIGVSAIKFTLDNRDLKQGQPGYRHELIQFKKYPADRRICPYHYLVAYLERSSDMRGKETKLILTTKKPFTRALSNTIARWIKEVL